MTKASAGTWLALPLDWRSERGGGGKLQPLNREWLDLEKSLGLCAYTNYYNYTETLFRVGI